MEQSKQSLRPTALTIGRITVNPPLVLAPMAGVTDDIFRSLAAAHGAGMVTTEMVSVEGLRRSQPMTWRLCGQDTPLDVPLAVQLFGRDPETMAEAAKMLAAKGVEIIDINAGCPVKKVVKQGAGASLLREPDRLAGIVERVKTAVDIPVTVKLRLGWNQHCLNIVEVARLVESAGADAVTVHGRTAAQLYSGTADWSWIRKTKAAINIPVIGNGDVSSPSLALRIMRETDCDAVMIGRASLGNPWIFSAIAERWGYQSRSETPGSWFDFCQTAAVHFENYLIKKRKPSGHCRQILIWYSKGRPESAKLRSKLYELDRPEEMLHSFCAWAQGLEAKGLPFKANQKFGN